MNTQSNSTMAFTLHYVYNCLQNDYDYGQGHFLHGIYTYQNRALYHRYSHFLKSFDEENVDAPLRTEVVLKEFDFRKSLELPI